MQHQDIYIIKGGHEGAERLRILADVMWPYTKPFLEKAGLRKGMICLDAGCGNGEITKRMGAITGEEGHVTGIDFDPSIIAIAQQQSTQIDNIEFRQFNIETDDLGEDKFDFIFCRFILSHLTSPETALQKVKNALRPKGILAIEDVDFQGHFCYPQNYGFSKYVEWYEQVAIKRGSNPFIGQMLYKMLKDLHMEDVALQVQMPSFFHGDGKLLAILTMNAIRKTVIMEQMASEKEVDEVINDLKSFTDHPDSILSLPRIFQLSSIRNI